MFLHFIIIICSSINFYYAIQVLILSTNVVCKVQISCRQEHVLNETKEYSKLFLILIFLTEFLHIILLKYTYLYQPVPNFDIQLCNVVENVIEFVEFWASIFKILKVGQLHLATVLKVCFQIVKVFLSFQPYVLDLFHFINCLEYFSQYDLSCIVPLFIYPNFRGKFYWITIIGY